MAQVREVIGGPAATDTGRELPGNGVEGAFVDFRGERFYRIRHVDRMPSFFVSVVSNSDHWLFLSSTGGLTAGRVSAETALFPYETVDKIHRGAAHTGPKTLVRVERPDTTGTAQPPCWEPFNREHDDRFVVERNLYRSLCGNQVCFEEINAELELAFRYAWRFSDEFGLVREAELENLADRAIRLEVLDGLQNVLPAGTPRSLQSVSSNLIDAYKWSELDADTGLAMFVLYSGISDRADPCESLRANTIFCRGLEQPVTLLSSLQLAAFRRGQGITTEKLKRGIRGAYFAGSELRIEARSRADWRLVANLEQSQAEVVGLRDAIAGGEFDAALDRSMRDGSDDLAGILAVCDGFQRTADETVDAHHLDNVLFNVCRGGFFFDQYRIDSADFARTLARSNRDVYERQREFLAGLPERISFDDLLRAAGQLGDARFEGLCYEYLPITFGRRHGDPSRPWNEFAIRLRDADGSRLLTYQGNWRDIFQNWEALLLSYPEFIESTIVRFVNASTADGYNPYRITKEGIDWEVEDLEDPWSNIGFWGDHQIIYLQKLLELSRRYHPDYLGELLDHKIFCYANVPYRLRSFEKMVANPKKTVDFDGELARLIDRRVETLGSDGKLLLDTDGSVLRVNLAEKLLVPLLAKLSNLVIGGGIWLNTQRPEWNDANNALVGQGLSMVTLYYLRRYVAFLRTLLDDRSGALELSARVADWLNRSGSVLNDAEARFEQTLADDESRFDLLRQLGEAACRYRSTVYADGPGQAVAVPVARIVGLLDQVTSAVDISIRANRRDDGLYHAYNLVEFRDQGAAIGNLYEMLEGQVAVLSSGAIPPDEAADLLDALFDSKLYREDQASFMLYPDRSLPGFLDKNRIPADALASLPLLTRMLADGEHGLLERDLEGDYRFNADLVNRDELLARLDRLASRYGDELATARQPICALYESVFNHRAFTGRSGGMFGFEGLGCIYWHMVAKLLLVVQENFLHAADRQVPRALCQRLGEHYYRVRHGLGFNKTPAEYGAFPTMPYSHTPKHSGARQPGMTGQVKEEILARFGELGVVVEGGVLRFRPALLRTQEFNPRGGELCYLDVDNHWQTREIPANGLAFTLCQVPIVYCRVDDGKAAVTVVAGDGEAQRFDGLALTPEWSSALLSRTGAIDHVRVELDRGKLFDD